MFKCAREVRDEIPPPKQTDGRLFGSAHFDADSVRYVTVGTGGGFGAGITAGFHRNTQCLRDQGLRTRTS